MYESNLERRLRKAPIEHVTTTVFLVAAVVVIALLVVLTVIALNSEQPNQFEGDCPTPPTQGKCL
jgi:hypothetical protein